MSREDIAILLPDNFVLGMKLYKLIQKYRIEHEVTDTDIESECNVSFSSKSTSEPSSTSRSASTENSLLGKRMGSSASGTAQKRQKTTSQLQSTDHDFSLPVFSDDIEQCMDQDAVLTTQQRNKIIRECCRALQGHCKKKSIPVSKAIKKHTARLLSEQCPNSLGSEVIILM